MESTDTPTLLQTTIAASGYAQDLELAWSYLLFCGVLESPAREAFVEAVKDKGEHPAAVAEALLDFATQRAELLDGNGALAARLRQYFALGGTLEPETEDEATLPGE